MLEDIKLIKPKNIKQDDKYSKNLYKHLISNRFKDYPTSIYVYYNRNIEGSFEEPKFTEIDWDNIRTSSIYIGYEMMEDIWNNKNSDTGKLDFGQVICKNLVSILRGNKLKEQGCYCAFGHNYVKRDWIDITDEFWDKYIEKGLCLLNIHDYEDINEDTRRCKHCEKEIHKTIKTYSYDYEIWE